MTAGSLIDGPTIQTSTGVYVNPLEPDSFTPDILDIAHALSHQARFSGHTRDFLSVAQHSWLVAELCPREHRLAGLLHDASEAYLVDLPRPIKHAPEMWRYRDAERALQARIYRHFGIPAEPAEVAEADLRVLAAEVRDLMPADPADWLLLRDVEPAPLRVEPWSPGLARLMFLSRFEALAGCELAAAA